MARLSPAMDLGLIERRGHQQRMMENQPKLHAWRMGLGLIFVATCIIIGFLIFKKHDAVINFVEEAEEWGVIAFIMVISVSIVLLMPTPFIKIFAGAIFPFPVAVLINFAGSMIGGLFAFIFGRWLFRDSILDIISKDSRMQRIDAAIGEKSMRISALVRLSPILPDEWLNYILAAGPVNLRTFMISNCASMAYCLAYAYYGYAIGEIALREGSIEGVTTSSANLGILLLGLVATIIATVVVTRVVMKALSDVIGEEE